MKVHVVIGPLKSLLSHQIAIMLYVLLWIFLLFYIYVYIYYKIVFSAHGTYGMNLYESTVVRGVMAHSVYLQESLWGA